MPPKRRGWLVHIAGALALVASARAGDLPPAPELAACAPAGDTLDLLRNGAVTSLSPLLPPLATLFAGVPCDPTLSPVLDSEVQQFSSAGPFPHESSDLGPSLPLVFYQVTS